MSGAVTVVIATRNRCPELIRTLRHLHELTPAPPVVVVDNGSTDGTVAAVLGQFTGVVLLALPRNRGATARNVGVLAARTPYVAFSDDDSWWAPGALQRATTVLDSPSAAGLGGYPYARRSSGAPRPGQPPDGHKPATSSPGHPRPVGARLSMLLGRAA